MAKLATLQHFPSVHAFAQHYGLILPRPYDWRLLADCPVGEVSGIPSLRGTAIATNGIVAAVITGEDKHFFCHIDYFIADADESVDLDSVKVPLSKLVKRERKSEKSPATPVDVSEFI